MQQREKHLHDQQQFQHTEGFTRRGRLSTVLHRIALHSVMHDNTALQNFIELKSIKTENENTTTKKNRNNLRRAGFPYLIVKWALRLLVTQVCQIPHKSQFEHTKTTEATRHNPNPRLTLPTSPPTH